MKAGETRAASKMRDARNGFLALLALMAQYLALNETGQTAGARIDPPLQLHASIPEISKCRQLIVVTTDDWKAVSATIQRFERTQGAQMSWRKVGKPFSGVIGSRGFAWGIGLHGTGEAGAPRKKEGDESSPAGVFRLFSVFGVPNSAQVRFLRFAYQQITPTMEAIDDPQSSTTGIPCARALYVGQDGTVITGRSMDWAEDIGPFRMQCFSFPRRSVPEKIVQDHDAMSGI